MLVTRSQRSITSARIAWSLAFAAQAWSVIVERSGLTLDTRFVPPVTARARARSCVYVLVRGAWIVHGGARFDAPRTFVVTESQLEGASGARPLTFAAAGDPFCAVEVHVHDADLKLSPSAAPFAIAATARVFEAAEASIRAVRESDEALEARLAELLGELARSGVIDPSVATTALRPASAALRALWPAFRPMIERLYLSPTLDEVAQATGHSTRQIDRYVEHVVDTFGLVGTRWRSSTRHLRLKLAVLLLSAEEASVAEVARAVGYGSTEAMARSFRDAQLPPPGTVQKALRAAPHLAGR